MRRHTLAAALAGLCLAVVPAAALGSEEAPAQAPAPPIDSPAPPPTLLDELPEAPPAPPGEVGPTEPPRPDAPPAPPGEVSPA